MDFQFVLKYIHQVRRLWPHEANHDVQHWSCKNLLSTSLEFLLLIYAWQTGFIGQNYEQEHKQHRKGQRADTKANNQRPRTGAVENNRRGKLGRCGWNRHEEKETGERLAAIKIVNVKTSTNQVALRNLYTSETDYTSRK